MNQEVRFPKGDPALDRILTLELVRVTERAAVAAARLRGRGDEIAADQAAVDAMRRELNMLPISGKVVIGEGERDEAPMLFIGEEVGNGRGPRVDIALDPLEGTTIAAKNPVRRYRTGYKKPRKKSSSKKGATRMPKTASIHAA